MRIGVNLLGMFLCLAMSGTGCGSEKLSLEQQILQKFKDSEKKLALEELLSIPWDRMYIIGPYAYEGLFDEHLNLHKEKIEETNIRYKDNIAVVLFLNNKDLVGSAVFDVNELNLVNAIQINKNNKIGYYSPKATVYFQKDRNGAFKVAEIVEYKRVPSI